MAGDEILEIAGTRTSIAQEARDLILGAPGTFLEIIIKRGSAIKEFNLRRLRPCCSDAVRQDRFIRNIAARLRETSEKKCWHFWKKHALAAAQRKRLLRKGASRFFRAKLGAAFLSWQTVVAELHMSRDVVRKIIQRLKGAKVSAAFATWVEHRTDMQKARESALKVVSRIMNKVF